MRSWFKARLGRMRVSTIVLIVAFLALFWVYHNFESRPAPAETPPTAVEEVREADAEVGPVGAGVGVGRRESQVLRAEEPEASVLGERRGRDQTLAPSGLQLEPGLVALPRGSTSRLSTAQSARPRRP